MHMSYLFTLRIWAILIVSAGYGWAGGHFIPSDAPVWAYAFQFVLLLVLLILATGFLKARRNIVGLNIFAVLTLVVNIVNIVRGAVQNGPYGSHNTIADLVPIILIMAGDLLWLATSFRRRPIGA